MPMAVCGPGTAPRGFEITGGEGGWKPATVRIEGACIAASSPEVAGPVALRYAWADDPDDNLVNTAGLPASPFRTDERF